MVNKRKFPEGITFLHNNNDPIVPFPVDTNAPDNTTAGSEWVEDSNDDNSAKIKTTTNYALDIIQIR